MQAVHDAVATAVWRMCRQAGLTARMEERHLVTGTNARPGDVFVEGLAVGADGEDTAIDVTVRDNRNTYHASRRLVKEMENDPTVAAERGEDQKRKHKVPGSDVTVADHLRARRRPLAVSSGALVAYALERTRHGGSWAEASRAPDVPSG